MPTFRVGSTATGFEVSFDTSIVELAIAAAPQAAFKRLRNYFFQTILDHRKVWLKVKGNKFGRGSGEEREAIGVSKIQSERSTPKPNEVIYSIQPGERRADSAVDAERKLASMRADIFTGNTILPIHQFGTDINTPNLMSIPYKTRGNKRNQFKTPTAKEWLRINPGKRLQFMRARRGHVHGFLLEVPRAGRQNRRKDGSEPPRRQFRMRFILTRKAEMDPTLRFYETWDSTEGLRNAAWAQAMAKLQKDLDEAQP